MLCLPHSICYDDPSLQQLLRAVEDAPTLTTLILAAWQVARVLPVQLVEAVRTVRVCQLPGLPACGSLLRRQGFAWRQLTSLCGPLRGCRRVGRCPQECAIPQVAPWEAALGGSRLSGPGVRCRSWVVPWPCSYPWPRWRACWAGPVEVWSVRTPYGRGCKLLAAMPWRCSRRHEPRRRRDTHHGESRWRRSMPPCPWLWRLRG